MTEPILHGLAPSSYVRTTRMACVEKGVDHTLRPVDLGSDAHRALHPWAKMPVLEHDGFVVYETTAIVRYLDAAFDSGARLVPTDPRAAARAEQLASVLNCYLYDALIKRYALQYIFAGESGPDRATIEGALEGIDRGLGVLESALAETKWLAGEDFSHADLLIAPAIVSAAPFPEVEARLAKHPRLVGWLEAVRARPSAEHLHPPRG